MFITSLCKKLCNHINNKVFTQLQHYLREQPDNPRSFNLVSAVTLYLQVTFHAITPECINLIIQVFTTLTELCAVSIVYI